MEEKTKKENKAFFELVEIPTQMQIAIRDNNKGQVISTEQAVVLILNELSALKKMLVGNGE